MQTRDCIADEFRDEWRFDARRKNRRKKTWCTYKEKQITNKKNVDFMNVGYLAE